MNYEPTPGSVAARVLAVLAERVEPITSGVLAEAANCDSASLGPNLEAAIKHGLIVRDRRSPRVSLWSLGKGIPVSNAAQQLQDDDPPVQRVVPAAAAQPLAWKAPALPVWNGPRAEPGEVEIPARLTAGPITNADVDEVSCRAPASPNTTPKGAQAAQAPVQTSGRGSTTPKNGAAPQGFRCALWSNGILEVHRETVGGAADFILFTADEVRQLVRYLRGCAEIAS